MAWVYNVRSHGLGIQCEITWLGSIPSESQHYELVMPYTKAFCVRLYYEMKQIWKTANHTASGVSGGAFAGVDLARSCQVWLPLWTAIRMAYNPVGKCTNGFTVRHRNLSQGFDTTEK